MKKIQYHLLSFIVLLFAFSACNEKLGINENNILETVSLPEIIEFEPESGSAGTEVAIKGEGFATVDSVQINGITTKIKNRISNTELLIELTGKESTGKISMFNSKGVGKSDGIFSVEHKNPENLAYSVPATEIITTGEIIDITGENMNVIQNVYLSGARGDRPARIIFQSADKLSFEVPVTCDSQAKILLVYYHGNEQKQQLSDEYTTDKIIVPPVLQLLPLQAYNGQSVLVKTTHPDKIDAVYYGEESLEFELEKDSVDYIRLYFPTQYATAKTDRLWIEHNDCEEEEWKKDFKIIVPNCYAHFDVYVTAHGDKSKNSENSFFNAVEGRTYTNCEAIANPTKIDFITYSNGNGGFVFYGPHNLTAGTLKNFYCGSNSLTAEGQMDVALFNSTTVKFRRLQRVDSSGKPKEAESALIDKFINNEIIDINEGLFTGISEPASNSISYYKNATGKESTYLPGDVIWFQNTTTGKNGLFMVRNVNYSGVGQDKWSSAYINVLYQK